MIRVFIDGSAGTTGLRIVERLEARRDVALIRLPEALRKDTGARRDALNGADVAFLCLPDDAAREAAALVENPDTAVIDTSTAHRVHPDWVYGLPELTGQRERIRASKRIANPGCHATGFIALVAPLTAAGAIPADAALSCFSLTGYSGGGKKMIARYEDEDRDALLDAPRLYGLGQTHKHLPEMQKYANLSSAPVFAPIVAPYRAGMEVMVPLFAGDRNLTPGRVGEIYSDYYKTGLVRFAGQTSEEGFMSAGALCGRDDLEITVQGNDERLILVARFDNLGKGASGAAIQNMNLLTGLEESEGLNVG